MVSKSTAVVSARLPNALVHRVQNFQREHQLETQGEALRLLLEAGLDSGEGITVDWGSLEAIQTNARNAGVTRLYKLIARVLKEEGYE